jgi:hypothetical protein
VQAANVSGKVALQLTAVPLRAEVLAAASLSDRTLLLLLVMIIVQLAAGVVAQPEIGTKRATHMHTRMRIQMAGHQLRSRAAAAVAAEVPGVQV